MGAALVLIGILVIVDIALHLWSMWPEGDNEDQEAASPLGFQAYDPDEDEEGVPEEL
jgi:hypothetical protein